MKGFLRTAGVVLALATFPVFATDVNVRIYPRPTGLGMVQELSSYDGFSVLSNALGLSGIALPPQSKDAAQLIVPPKPFAPPISTSALFVVDDLAFESGDFITSGSASFEILDVVENMEGKVPTVTGPTVRIYSSHAIPTEQLSGSSVTPADVLTYLGKRASNFEEMIETLATKQEFSHFWSEIREIVATVNARSLFGSTSGLPDIIVFQINSFSEMDGVSLVAAREFINAMIDATMCRLSVSGRKSGAAIYVSHPQDAIHAWVRRQSTTLPDGVFSSSENCVALTNNCNSTYLGFECKSLDNSTYGCRSALGKYLNKTACEYATSNCSSHGSCVEAKIPDRFISPTNPLKAYTCSCNIANGTYYSGSKCASVDIAAQFNILTAVTLIIFFILVIVIVTTCTAADDSDMTILGGSSGRAKTD